MCNDRDIFSKESGYWMGGDWKVVRAVYLFDFSPGNPPQKHFLFAETCDPLVMGKWRKKRRKSWHHPAVPCPQHQRGKKYRSEDPMNARNLVVLADGAQILTSLGTTCPSGASKSSSIVATTGILTAARSTVNVRKHSHSWCRFV